MSICKAGVLPACSCVMAMILVGCGVVSPKFTSHSSSLELPEANGHQLHGIASYYSDEFHGRKTANGETYDMHDLTAAHRTLPFNTKLRVRNLDTNLSVIVRINDRGPFKDDRVIDLSLEAAKQVGMISNGTAPVQVEILELGSQTK